MIKANHTYWGKLFFKYFAKIRLGSHFRSIEFIGSFDDRNLPILVISNHFTWWDGFIQLLLNEKFFHRKFHVMMLEEQLKRFMILNNGGCFSVKKNSREILESLQYSVDLLSDKQNIMLLFPQGELQSMHTDYFAFEAGLDYILKKRKNEIDIIFNVNLVDYFSFKKPGLSIYFKRYLLKNNDLKQIEIDFNTYATECKLQQLRK